MDWIDPRFAKKLQRSELARGKKEAEKPTALAKLIRAVVASPLDVWGTAYGHALDQLHWPDGCSCESSFLFSMTNQEHREILQRVGLPSGATEVNSNDSSPDSNRNPVSFGRVSEPSPWLLAAIDEDLDVVAYEWLEDMVCQPHAALGTAALAWSLPQHAARSTNTWLANWLQKLAAALVRLEPKDEDAAICHLVVRCELPLLLARVTGASRKSIMAGTEQAMDNLAQLIEQAEDQPAAWIAYGASYLRAALACVLRARVLATSLGLRKWFPPQKRALAGLLEHALRWSRDNGTCLLADPVCQPEETQVWLALLEHARKSQSLVPAALALGLSEKSISMRRARKKFANAEMPPLSHHNEEARCVVMLSDWLHRSGRVAVDYSDTIIRCELVGMKGRSLLSGEWTAAVQCDGQAQMQLDDWERVCWFTDDDVDYLEVEAKFGSSCCIQRQIVLLRQERLVILADALLADHAARWTLQSTLGFANEVGFETSDKNNEAFLTASKDMRGLILPLSMPEWRRQNSQSSIFKRDDKLNLQSETTLARMYVPTVFSLNGAHASQPFTWRQLTVAEELAIVQPDVAAAFRAQIGKEQWLLYRTLAKPARRTAMGLHTGADFLAARFCGESGECETLVEVVAEES